MINDLNTINWDTILIYKGTQQSWDCVKEVLDKVVEDHVPIRSVKNGGKPIWLNKNVMRIIRKKRKLWKSYTNSRDHEDYLAYKNVKGSVKKSIKI